MSEGKIAYWEALGFKAQREAEFAKAHTYWQNSEHLKRKNKDGLETKQRKKESRKEKARGVRGLRRSKDLT